MPKGVEHQRSAVSFEMPLLTVPSAVMPKGVEHMASLALMRLITSVPSAVMPKGVEHFAVLVLDSLGTTAGAVSRDAERR